MKLFIAIVLMVVSFTANAQSYPSCGVECQYLPSYPPVTQPSVVHSVQHTVTPQLQQSIQSSQIAAANAVYRGTTINQVFNTSAAAGQPKPTAPACK